MADIGFCGDAYEAPSIYQDAQQLVNWYLEDDPNKEGSQTTPSARGYATLYPTPGYELKFTCPIGERGAGLYKIGPVRGMRTLSGGNILLVAVSDALYSVNSSFVATAVGTLATTTGVVVMDDNGIDAYIVDGTNRYSYTIATQVFSTAPSLDGAFFGADRVATVDNFFVYNRPDSQQWAASTVLSSATPALSFASKFGSPDNLVSLMVLSREVFLLGEVSSEAWIDVGSFPFPFQIIPGTSTQHGCAAKHSVSRLGDSFAFVSQDTRGQGIIVIGQGYGFHRISTHSVEQSLLGQMISDAIAFTYQAEGHEFYVVTFPTIDLTWVYDLVTGKWHKWLSVDSYNVYHRHPANCYAFFQGFNLIGDYQNGMIYSLSNDLYTDNGNTIRRLRRCPHLVSDFKRQFFEELQIQFQPGVGLQTGQGDDPQAMLRWSNDGGSTWSNDHWKTIGKVGKYKNRVIWRRLGQARDRIYEVVVTDPIRAVIVSANLIGSGGSS